MVKGHAPKFVSRIEERAVDTGGIFQTVSLNFPEAEH
jgi:hypothetical protein